LVHRDLKPANIGIAGGKLNNMEEVEAGIAKFVVFDFGLALKEGDQHERLINAHTPKFTSSDIMRDPSLSSMMGKDAYSIAMITLDNLAGLRVASSLDELMRDPYKRALYPEPVRVKFDELRKIYQAIGVSPDDMALFEDIVALTIASAEPSTPLRMSKIRELHSPVMRVSASGRVLGPDPSFSQKIDHAQKTANQASFRNSDIPPPPSEADTVPDAPLPH